MTEIIQTTILGILILLTGTWTDAGIPDHLFRLPLLGSTVRSQPVVTSGGYHVRDERATLLEPLEARAGVRADDGGMCEGACISSRACSYYGGQAKGVCINGNVCCKFERSCDGVSKEKISFFSSPDFPTFSNESFECSHFIYPNEDVCSLRVDFLELNISKGMRFSGGIHKCLTDSIYVLNALNGPHDSLCEFQNYSAIFWVNPKNPKPVDILFVVQSETSRWRLRVTQMNCKKLPEWSNEPDCGRQLLFDAEREDDNGHHDSLLARNRDVSNEDYPQQGHFMNPYIVNGENAEGREFPWQASIQANSKHRCGATIINEYFLLTAAHCFAGRVYESPDKLKVVVGDLILDSDVDGGHPQILEVENVILNFNYKSFQTHVNDIAIVKVKSRIIYNSAVQPICLPAQDFPTDNKPAIVSGWGRLNATHPLASSPTLQKLKMDILPNQKCKEMHLKEIARVAKKNLTDTVSWLGTSKQQLMGQTNSQVCAVSAANTTVCFGDSGGGLVMQNEDDGRFTQVGVVSYGLGACDISRITPVAFSRVSEYLQFISIATISD